MKTMGTTKNTTSSKRPATDDERALSAMIDQVRAWLETYQNNEEIEIHDLEADATHFSIYLTEGISGKARETSTILAAVLKIVEVQRFTIIERMESGVNLFNLSLKRERVPIKYPLSQVDVAILCGIAFRAGWELSGEGYNHETKPDEMLDDEMIKWSKENL